MSESSGTPLKTSPNGVQGLAMMAPVVGLPFGIHALGGAVVAVAGLAVTVAPIAVPFAVPFIYNVASRGGLDSVIRKILPSVGTPGAAQHGDNQAVKVTTAEASPVAGAVNQSDV